MSTTFLVTLLAQTCWHDGCGRMFGLSEKFTAYLRESGATFYCPAGHALRFGEPEADRLRKEVALKDAAIARLREDRDHQQRMRFQTERRLQAQRGATTRIKRRIAHGLCPYCHRTFKALANHIAEKHPGFRSETPDA